MSKIELLDNIWGVVAVSENVLSTAICVARKVIGDDHTLQWAIKTTHRRGYRFMALVEVEIDRRLRSPVRLQRAS